VTPTVLLLAELAVGTLPSITIDACVAVDAEEVRRLAAIEMGAFPGGVPAGSFEVVVGCNEGSQQLRLIEATRGQVADRSIDLRAVDASDRDARARELALAIAELVRSSPPESSVAVPVSPAPTPFQEALRPVVEQMWHAEIGLGARANAWSGRAILVGADLTGRLHFGRLLIGDLQVGGRTTQRIAFDDRVATGRGFSTGLGVAFDVTPDVRWAGFSLGARVGLDWLRYAATDASGDAYDGADATGVNALGTATAFVSIAGPLRVTLDAGVGAALHSIVIREQGRTLVAASGALVSASLGVALGF
jgi:hypothetical protein